jgi:hypothetical protein
LTCDFKGQTRTIFSDGGSSPDPRVLRPVRVEAMTTRTVATATAMSQRTQSIPGQPLPSKALQINQPIKTPPMPQKNGDTSEC